MELRLSSSAPLINFVYKVEQQTHDHSLFHTLTSILVTEFPVIKIETKICAVLTKFKHLIPHNRVHKRKACLYYIKLRHYYIEAPFEKSIQWL